MKLFYRFLKTIVFIVLICPFIICSAQKQANRWYFGSFAGIDFSSGDPVSVTDGKLEIYEGCATLCDENGDLLLYSNGLEVYNSSHELVHNGDSLLGHNSATNSALILPFPDKENKYIIITDDAVENPDSKGILYNILDLNYDGGKGIVTEKNIPLHPKATERFAVARHCDGKNLWLISHEIFSNKFTTYFIDKNGINHTPIEQRVGKTQAPEPDIDPNSWYYGEFSGEMKVSASCTKLAMVSEELFMIEIFSFDNQTGDLDLLYTIDTKPLSENGVPYGVEFSPNEKFIYFTLFGGHIYQADISDISNDNIQIRQVSNSIGIYGSAQVGPNQKIYIAKDQSTYLASIENPDLPAPNCNYIEKSIDLKGRKCRIGLPKYIAGDLWNCDFEVNSFCLGTPTEFKLLNPSCVDSVRWSFDDSASGSDNTSLNIHPEHKFSKAGVYNVFVKVYKGKASYSKTKEVVIHDIPRIEFKNEVACTDNIEVTDKADYLSELYNGYGVNAQCDSIDPNRFKVLISDSNNCTFLDTVDFRLNSKPQLKSEYDNYEICDGESVSINVSGADSYFWVDSGSESNSQSFSPNSSKRITVYGINKNGCRDTLLVPVKVKPSPDVTITTIPETDTIPQDDLLLLIADGADSYIWNSSLRGDKFTINSSVSGVQNISVTGEKDGCFDTETYTITVTPKIKIPILKTCEELLADGYQVKLELWKNPKEEYRITPDTIGKISGNWFISDTIPLGVPYDIIITDGADSVNLTGVEDCHCHVEAFFDGDNSFCTGDSTKITLNITNDDITDITKAWYFIRINKDGNKLIELDSVQSPFEFYAKQPGKFELDSIQGFGFDDFGEVDTCTSFQTQAFNLKMYNLPQVNINATDTSMCKGDEIKLYVKDNFNEYIWNDTLKSSTLITSEQGVHKVKVTDNHGCRNIGKAEVKYNPEASLLTSVTDTLVCENSYVKVDVWGADKYFLNDSLMTPPFIMLAEENSTYNIIGKNKFNCKTDKVVTINVKPLPKVKISSFPDTLICEDDKVILSASGASSYNWQDGSAKRDLYIIPPSGTHNYSVIGEKNQCFDTANVNVVVKEKLTVSKETTYCDSTNVNYKVEFDIVDTTGVIITPVGSGDINGSVFTSNNIRSGTEYSFKIFHPEKCNFINISGVKSCNCPIVANLSGDETFCEGDSVKLKIKVENGINKKYKVNLGLNKSITNQFTLTTDSISMFVKKPGTYNVLYVQDGEEGCVGSSKGSINVEMHKRPELSISTETPIICPENSALLTAKYSSFDTVKWMHTDIDTSALKVDKPGKYRMVATTYHGCKDTADIEIRQYEKTIPEMSDDTIVCKNSEVILDAGTLFKRYKWNTGDTTSYISVNKSGKYHVDLIDFNNCTSVGESNVAQVEVPDILVNDTVYNSILKINANGGTKPYIYSLDGVYYTTNNTFINLKQGEYNVFVKDSNNCISESSINIEVMDLGVQKLFSPNNDGMNEVWKPENLSDHEDAEVTVFDRYGRKIIQFVMNDDGWDGTYKGKRLPSDTYWYYIDLKNGTPPYTGKFLLRR